ncbi:MAG: phenylacetic acid degradation bifunctional protein PaaZ, partial [Shimia sp.]
MLDVHSYQAGRWHAPDDGARPLVDAASGAIFGRAGHTQFDAARALEYARDVGRPALRALSYHDRARLLKSCAEALAAQKPLLRDLSYHTGATLRDHAFDIDGGIGTTFVFATIGIRELPAEG